MAVNESTINQLNIDLPLYEYFYGGIACLEAVLIIVSNVLTFVAVHRTKKLREIPTNIFILSLAASDGMVGLLTPVFVSFKFLDFEDGGNGIVCTIYGAYFAIFFISLLTLLAIAGDRYTAVAHPISHRQRLTTKRARIISIVIWIVPFIAIVPVACLYDSNGLEATTSQLIFPKLVLLLLLQIIIFGALLGTVVIYISIYVKLKTKQRVGSERNRSNSGGTGSMPSRTTKAYVNMMALVLGYLLIVCIPNYVLLSMLRQFSTPKPTWAIHLKNISIIMVYSNSFMNPVIYSWKNRNFRQAYRDILCCSQPRMNRLGISVISGNQTPNRPAV
ncbi:hypothetical protein LSH36_121g12006 [Paralvinella palmiformis]|uniref:G-protein coupled receptors family 1 profile domain-containing protein n=1 Tax=Paralvinella palmiformis TaxID=53620 RepID=A0AAD9N8L0_9ANNE|nr:hypothetical protein LSH36_121g12006 [Paralvinella palmiformis]